MGYTNVQMGRVRENSTSKPDNEAERVANIWITHAHVSRCNPFAIGSEDETSVVTRKSCAPNMANVYNRLFRLRNRDRKRRHVYLISRFSSIAASSFATVCKAQGSDFGYLTRKANRSDSDVIV